MDGDQMARSGGIILELGPEQGDVIVDGPGRRVLLIAPDRIQQLIPRDHLARAGRQNAQDSEFLARHVQRFFPFSGLETFKVYADITEMQSVRQIAGLDLLPMVKKGDAIRNIRIIRVGQAARDFKTDDETFKKLLEPAK